MGDKRSIKRCPQNSKRLGTWYESLFIPKCLSKGLHPHDTYGDYLAHDMLVMNDAGCVFKVQIKGTNTMVTDGRRYPKFRITAKRGNRVSKKAGLGDLDCTKVDILAAYVEKHDLWYLIPCLAVTNMSVWLFPDNPDSKARYEEYKDNWNCFF